MKKFMVSVLLLSIASRIYSYAATFMQNDTDQEFFVTVRQATQDGNPLGFSALIPVPPRQKRDIGEALIGGNNLITISRH